MKRILLCNIKTVPRHKDPYYSACISPRNINYHAAASGHILLWINNTYFSLSILIQYFFMFLASHPPWCILIVWLISTTGLPTLIFSVVFYRCGHFFPSCTPSWVHWCCLMGQKRKSRAPRHICNLVEERPPYIWVGIAAKSPPGKRSQALYFFKIQANLVMSAQLAEWLA